ncbi:unnamed protein product [Brachionus calyciflorus]|uniref:EF-hand domain-containing protein n=1 Tax=Brachionus calyciflorus TaxID=104777 RepID=A0A814II19_9BILA|nr:unnamed protein product [Brachionus calyciflorus]
MQIRVFNLQCLPELKLTEEQLKEEFNRHDKNNDGYLSRSELQQAFVRIEIEFSDDYIDSFYEEAMKNEQGNISFQSKL